MGKNVVSFKNEVKLAKEKLASSGLTLEDAKTLSIEILNREQTSKLHETCKPLASLRFNYISPYSVSLVTYKDYAPFRGRYLEEEKGFAQQTDNKKSRYFQLPGTAVLPYFPRNLEIGWKKVIQDPSIDILITEGELKAASAAKLGLPTIGLGGVYNFRSAKLGIEFIPDLDRINWRQRNVYIVYDSDFRTNGDVCNAINLISEQLMNRGAIPLMIMLPDATDKKKNGLDDFIVEMKNMALPVLKDLMRNAPTMMSAKNLWELNQKVIYVVDPGVIINISTNQVMNPMPFKEHHFSNISTTEMKLDKDGNWTIKPIQAAPAWLKWPCRNEATTMTYAPGKPRIIQSDDATQTYNTWTGYGCKPIEGDVQPFLDLLDHIFTGAEPEAKQWFLRWCAYPLQYQGMKLFSSVLLHGRVHGTGKSAIGYALGKIYGKNFTEIDQDDLTAPFNEWAVNKQFILADDLSTSGSDRRHDAGKLRKLITQKEIRIKKKYIPSYSIPDCINYFFTANVPDAFFLEDTDRRSFIHEVVVPPLSEEFYAEYDLWLHGKGPSHLFYYLLNLDLDDFNPMAPAIVTHAKRRMIHDVKSDIGSWCSTLMDSPDQILVMGEIKLNRDLYTPKELLMMYDPLGKARVTANGLGRELKRIGFQQVLNGDTFIAGKNIKSAYYAIRNTKMWLSANRRDIIDHIVTSDAPQPAQTKTKRY